MPPNILANASAATSRGDRIMDRVWVPADNGPVVPHRRRHRRLAIMREESGPTSSWFNFYKLNSLVRPGLNAKDFFDLFTQCRCGLIMTRPAFTRHHCRFTVIDLTKEEDGEDIPMIDLTLGEQAT
ncbi:hypothetical protein FIBSPDRAFT_953395 [Athelia psychrophila]|uniref:Uncharacterized protein n=1 Tax=Athelia psychrophila TaxID=1759441 RepID=A0A166KG45_9AGAM|nr:hypothetical protein FIBSPDRAFT_953395 [Fibularhizoctonia sp. CBS 109695]